MCEVKTYSPLQRYAYDPTRTTTLRNVFARTMRKKFRELDTVIREAVVQQDVFGLEALEINAELQSPGYRAFDYPRVSDQMDSFMEWLNRQEEAAILLLAASGGLGRLSPEPWTNMYINDAYRRGVIRARSEMIKAGYDVPSMAQTGIDNAMLLPRHRDTLDGQATTTFQRLKNITEVMNTELSQIVAQGIIDEERPSSIARKIAAAIASIGIVRAELLARTEVVRTHHLATIREYEYWGTAGVTVIAEWSTAGDERVCSVCIGMHGNQYPLKEIEHMIPVHPGCRCIAIPVGIRTEQ